MVTADTNTTRDAAAVIPDAGRDGPTMLSGVKATFTIGTAKSTTACESGKASVYVASSMMWSLSCNGNGARLTLGGPGPSKGMLTDPKNHEFVLSNDMGAVVSGLPTTMKLNVTTWDLVTTHFVGDLQAHWNAAGGKPAADLDVTFDVNLN